MRIAALIGLLLAVFSAAEAACIFSDYKRYGEPCTCSESCLDKSYCLRNATGGFACQCLPCQRFDPDLKECVEEVVDIDHCANNPCQQICTDTGNDFKCSCQPGYLVSQSDPTKCDDIDECGRVFNPSRCEEICADVIKADIYVLLDASGSIAPQGWKKALTFTVNLSKWLPLSPEYVQFGFGIFSNTFVHKFDLNKYTDHDELSQAVTTTEQLKYNTATFLALTKISEIGYLTSAAYGSRPGVNKYLFLITDGRSDNTTKTVAAAEVLRNQGIKIFAISVGVLDLSELYAVAQVPENVFSVKNFNDLDKIRDKITQRVCTEVEECQDNPCEQNCVNTPGGFNCTCKDGDVVSPLDPTKCVDANECDHNPCEHDCTDKVGGFICSCRDGFVVSATDPTRCDDINECEAVNYPPCEQICINTVGGYRCSCREGFQVNATDPSTCQDIDECKDNPCQQICTNTQGSYRCSCEDGYEISASDPSKCEDINECTNNPCQQDCKNTDGSFECSCREGYEISSSDPTKCDDINECTNNPCQQDCKNTDGSFECSCREGYEVSSSDTTKCDDINECSNNPCQHDCTNSEGSFACSCREGYEVSATDPTKCDDVNECTNSPCEQTCTNTDGSFKCSCRDGFIVSPTDPNKCEDEDECKSNPCQQICTNIDHGYKCSCEPGYVISTSNSSKCTDIDECKTKPCEQICTNLPGSYECTCNDGFISSAADPNKCEESCVDILKADIYVLTDSSGSIPPVGWGRALNFVVNLIQMFPLGRDAVQFGFGIFSTSFVHKFDVNKYTDQAELSEAVLKTEHLKLETFTDVALDKINENGYLTSVAHGSRPGVDKYLLVITDGQSRNTALTLAAAQRLKDQGIKFFCVGVGLTNPDEIVGIAGGPDNVFSVKSFSDLSKIKNKIITRVCHEYQRAHLKLL